MEKEKILRPIEKFKSFKGIYIERTKDYFLCDFYIIQMPGEPAFCRVSVSLTNKDQIIVELQESESGTWKYRAVHDKLPAELEQQLSDYILNVCLK